MLNMTEDLSTSLNDSSHFTFQYVNITSSYVAVTTKQRSISQSTHTLTTENLLSKELFYSDYTTKQMRAKLVDPSSRQLLTIHERLPAIDWQMLPSTETVAGFPCRLASAVICGDSVLVKFTSSIPVPGGPRYFHGLPGLILEVQYANRKRKLLATRVTLGSASARGASQHTYADPPKELRTADSCFETYCEAQRVRRARGSRFD